MIRAQRILLNVIEESDLGLSQGHGDGGSDLASIAYRGNDTIDLSTRACSSARNRCFARVRYRCCFTLLEVMLTLSILAVIGSVIGMQIYRLINHTRFEKEIFLLYTTFQEAQVLSCAYQTDIGFDLFEEKGKIYYRFSTAEPLPKQTLSQERVELSLVKKFFENGVVKKRVHLDLYAGGRVQPSCVLSLASSLEKKGPVLYLDFLHGYLVKFSHNSPVKVVKNII